MKSREIFAIIDQHFAFETPELIERVCETFADEIIWEAPARDLLFTKHDQILDHYRNIAAGILEPVKIEVLRRFAAGNEAFDDRIIYFTAGKDNVWDILPGKRVQLRLIHYFKIKKNKICHEVGYEIWKIIS
ncbi:MAG: nuclear transport factor 2 family protein [Chlamydiales bacterium]|nr:nuclear transport factor 2 family protein [Chlamydiales bacterium]